MGRGEQTSWAQRMAILEWLEEPSGENFKLITGSASNGKSVVAGSKLTKEHGYSALADHVNERALFN